MSARTEPRREDLYARIREDILSCQLAPGQNLHESELAARFTVSKSPVRDALMRLEAERLVIVQPRKGYRVAPVSLSDAAEIFDLRRLLESAVMEAAASSASPRDLADLDRFRVFAGSDGNEGFVAYNRAFHKSVADLCANRRLRAVTHEVVDQLDRLIVLELLISKNAGPAAMVDEHGGIIEALQAREGRKAARLAVLHIERAKRRVLASLANSAIQP